LKFAVVQFPGSNCDQDCLGAINSLEGASAEYVWHKGTSLEGFDAIVLPGGFSFGDYLRCGAIARFSPIMQAVKADAAAGKLVIGICNGFQILCEAGLLPGALVRNQTQRFICRMATLRVEAARSPFTIALDKGMLLRMPVAHGEGCYFADADTLKQLEDNRQVVFRYCSASGEIGESTNVNGSLHNIAGICNAQGNVLGMMPHPERAADKLLGCTDGLHLFESVLSRLMAIA